MIHLNTQNSLINLSDLSPLFPLLSKLRTCEFTDWIDLPENKNNTIKLINKFIQEKGEKFERIIACGIGGSALGILMLQKALFPFDQKLTVIDNLDSVEIDHLLKTINPSKTLVIIITKSGTTLETITQYFILKQFFAKQAPKKNLQKENFIHITDPDEGYLREITEKEKVTSFDIPKKT